MAIRPRRLRHTPALRRLARETRLSPDAFIYPIFVRQGVSVREDISSMPGIARLSVDIAVREAQVAVALGIPAVLLFGIPASKNPLGTRSFAPDGIVQTAVRAIKDALPELAVITDVCLCAYTDHGHCGLLSDTGEVLNDDTLAVLGRIASSHAEAGADIVAPSGMMDGMVAAVRHALDGDGHTAVSILSYSVKYASNFYGPFRDAGGGAPRFGDRKTHQMDPANTREALREVALDVEQGADMLMVKPALAYLDVIHRVRQAYPILPLAAYNVSGEYAMLKAAAASGYMDERRATLEALGSMVRAGADLVITYHALEAARWIRDIS